MKMLSTKNDKNETINEFPFLEKLNYRKLNGLEYQAIV
jgi:hypothetical protein